MTTRIREKHIVGRLVAPPIDKLLQLTPVKNHPRLLNALLGLAHERRHRVERRRPAPPALPDRQNPGDRRKRPDRRQRSQ
jgi:hypothetical protein